MLSNLPQKYLKLLQKEWLKTAEASGDLTGNKIANKIKGSQKLDHRIIQKQMKKIYLEKNIYPQN